MQPDPGKLLEVAGITIPLIGFYDAPDTCPFEPLVEPERGKHVCIFSFYLQWLSGKTLRIGKDSFGCGGAGYWLCGNVTRSRKDFVEFLVDGEGLKSSHELMNRWLAYHKPFHKQHQDILIGPLREGQYEYLKSVTFYVNPDQLGLLILGASYNSAPGGCPPVIAPFGSGCMELVTLFDDLNAPQAVIGATDIAMRRYLPPDIIAFTVTRPMFKQLCELDERSFLYKPFWKNLLKARRTAGLQQR